MKRILSEHLTSQAAIARLNTLVEEQCRVISALEQPGDIGARAAANNAGRSDTGAGAGSGDAERIPLTFREPSCTVRN